MRSGRVELADDVGNGRAHARDVVKAILGDHIGKWSVSASKFSAARR
jgi:hypothetical protein